MWLDKNALLWLQGCGVSPEEAAPQNGQSACRTEARFEASRGGKRVGEGCGALTSYVVPVQNCLISFLYPATAAEVIRVKGTR